ncbi:para-aminobenzoate synthetase [Corynebacterium mycetoides]|uniref:aminodeoxychorismate synthase n=1 Tax=Corynebacterium mycetoides TaxID=38302 RepID=A0A1G9N479_9CORY|nr:aminodeoxychorismate synthase component I [Corynebacterium mycetoides]SDL81183.1 para-aminobenzoate synthetase [Corynebacterium mycetoides]
MILLIDNRDSYTFNLAHLIASAAGQEPEVVRADDVAARGVCERIARGVYSHVVISPGPGTPESEADFAGSRAVIEAAADIPVLGVCLGHQGLALLAGAAVQRTQPRHGHVSRISHSGVGIFAGLPQDFAAVRYHSLHVDPAHAGNLRVHARSEDGVIQGLEVLGRPHWGVQFHPESVLTEHGADLMRNFLALPPRRAAAWGVTHEHVDVDADLDTEATFRALRGSGPDAFWLDSATGDGFTIMGTTAGPLSRTLTWPGCGDALAALADELAAGIDTAGIPDLPFTGGWVGYVGYEAAELTLPGFTSRHARSQPDVYLVRPQSFLCYDHAARRAHLMAVHRGAPGPETEGLLAALRQALSTQRPAVSVARVEQGAWRLSRAEYRGRFEAAKATLASGDSYEVCLTDTFEATTRAESLDLYSRLRRANPAPYASYLALGDVEVLSSSPERFLTVRGGTVEAKPIKGTLAVSHPPEQLLDDAKTRAENLMIVDLLRNDLGRVCVPGSVEVPRLMAVETYATVHQLVSTVTGRLRPETGLVDLVRATFPPGSMTGAPKERTCAVIDALEAGPRGVYSGAIGYFGFDGSADLSVVIRAAVKRGERISVGAGGAIVWDSDAESEYEEMHLKADAVLRGWT